MPALAGSRNQFDPVAHHRLLGRDQSIFGSTYRVTKDRGLFVQNSWAPHVTSTVHPSVVLRAPDEQQRHTEYQKLVEDLKKVRRLWEGLKK